MYVVLLAVLTTFFRFLMHLHNDNRRMDVDKIAKEKAIESMSCYMREALKASALKSMKKKTEKGSEMKRKNSKTFAAVSIISCISGLLIIHRRGIIAALKGDPIPKAPKWHFWCRPRSK